MRIFLISSILYVAFRKTYLLLYLRINLIYVYEKKYIHFMCTVLYAHTPINVQL